MFEPENIPKELRERPQWICWETGERNGKETKIPRKPDGSGYAKANDITTWGTFKQAVETAERKGWGIGFVFSSADPYVGIDLDSCVREDGGPKDWLPDLGPFAGNAFIERSPSGTGLHLILKDASVPSWWTNQDRDTDGAHEGVEVYDDGRYFTVTGDTLEKISSTTIDDDIDLAEWLEGAWLEFNDELPNGQTPDKPSSSAPTAGDSEDIDVDVYDVISSGSYPEGERCEHPVHGSDTGSNFMVDDGAETWRCWRHSCTGNALHLIGIEQGVISCGEWAGAGLSSDTWADIFDAAREAGYNVPAKKGGKPSLDVVQTDGGDVAAETGASETPQDIEPATSIDDEIKYILSDFDEGDITLQTATHRVAVAFTDHFSFVHPPEGARGWRDTLYVYNDEEGIYEPHGERFIAEKAERLLADFVSNQGVNELVGKITRMSGVDVEELETPPYRLCVGNGLLDFSTGELDDFTPNEYHKTKIDVDYNPEATCDRIDEFFHEIVEDNDVDTLYQLVAHTLYREYAAEKAAMLLGDGQNGKSVFLTLLEKFLGKYNVSHRSLQDLDGERFAANDLQGKLANVHPDMGDETVHDLGTFKKLTGRDIMTADVKYERPIHFENYATLLFAANRMPAMNEDTHALWRRWIYINFPYKFDDDDPDAKDSTPKRVLMRELTEEEELEGLLARCAEEIGEWWEGRDWFTSIHPPSEVRTKMKRASEPIYDFATVCLEVDEDSAVEKSKVRKCYRRYAREENLPSQEDNVFGEKLLSIRDIPIEAGQKRIDGQRRHVYKGIGLSSRGRQVLGLDTPEDEEQSTMDDGGPRGREEIMLDVVRELETPDSAVTENMAIGRATASMGLEQARSAFQDLKDRGAIYQSDSGWRVS